MEKRKELKLLLVSDVHIGKPATDRVIKNFKRIMREQSHGVDHILCPGDFANDARDSEYAPVLDTLSRFNYEQVSMVAGNHDVIGFGTVVFNFGVRGVNRQRFADKMKRFLPGGKYEEFPYLKIVGDIAVIGVDTIPPLEWGRPMSFIQSTGRIDNEQLGRLDTLLRSRQLDNKWVFVLMHHDPYDRRIKDPIPFLNKMALREVLESPTIGRNIILVAGHNHHCSIERITGNLLHFQVPSVYKSTRYGGQMYIKVKIQENLSYQEIK